MPRTVPAVSFQLVNRLQKMQTIPPTKMETKFPTNILSSRPVKCYLLHGTALFCFVFDCQSQASWRHLCCRWSCSDRRRRWRRWWATWWARAPSRRTRRRSWRCRSGGPRRCRARSGSRRIRSLRPWTSTPNPSWSGNNASRLFLTSKFHCSSDGQCERFFSFCLPMESKEVCLSDTESLPQWTNINSRWERRGWVWVGWWRWRPTRCTSRAGRPGNRCRRGSVRASGTGSAASAPLCTFLSACVFTVHVLIESLCSESKHGGSQRLASGPTCHRLHTCCRKSCSHNRISSCPPQQSEPLCYHTWCTGYRLAAHDMAVKERKKSQKPHSLGISQPTSRPLILLLVFPLTPKPQIRIMSVAGTTFTRR